MRTRLAGGFVFLFGCLGGACGEDETPQGPLYTLSACPAWGSYTPIHAIQGAGAASPLLGSQLTTVGIVTVVSSAPAAPGYFIRSLQEDGDPRTSEGLFIYSPDSYVSGDVVVVTGKVQEHFGWTELASVSASDRCATLPAPEPRVVAFAFDVLEALENDWVRFDSELTVTDLSSFSTYEEVRVASERLRLPLTGAFEPEPRTLAIDDWSYDAPTGLLGLDAPGAIGLGDSISELEGVVVEGFGAHRLFPTGTVTFARNPQRRIVVPSNAADLRVMAMNVQNYFTTLGDWGAQSQLELDRQTQKLVAALAGGEADVYALSEVEANGTTSVQALADALSDQTGELYAVAALSVPFSTQPALIYRTGSVSLDAIQQVSNADFLFTRPPLIAGFRRGDQRLTVAVAHLRGRSCSTAGATPDEHGPSCNTERRTLQAARLHAEVMAFAGSYSTNRALVVGDFNAFAEEPPVLEFTVDADPFVDLIEGFVAQQDRYTLMYKGAVGYVDHALASLALRGDVQRTMIWHINVDELRELGYRSSNPDGLFQPDPYRSADHDPVLVDLDM